MGAVIDGMADPSDGARCVETFACDEDAEGDRGGFAYVQRHQCIGTEDGGFSYIALERLKSFFYVLQAYFFIFTIRCWSYFSFSRFELSNTNTYHFAGGLYAGVLAAAFAAWLVVSVLFASINTTMAPSDDTDSQMEPTSPTKPKGACTGLARMFLMARTSKSYMSFCKMGRHGATIEVKAQRGLLRATVIFFWLFDVILAAIDINTYVEITSDNGAGLDNFFFGASAFIGFVTAVAPAVVHLHAGCRVVH